MTRISCFEIKPAGSGEGFPEPDDPAADIHAVLAVETSRIPG